MAQLAHLTDKALTLTDHRSPKFYRSFEWIPVLILMLNFTKYHFVANISISAMPHPLLFQLSRHFSLKSFPPDSSILFGVHDSTDDWRTTALAREAFALSRVGHLLTHVQLSTVHCHLHARTCTSFYSSLYTCIIVQQYISRWTHLYNLHCCVDGQRINEGSTCFKTR